MQLLDKHNVLDLIGKYKNRYHSCILTCFSFDFNFFEERVLPALRSANIRNIIVLIDGKYYDQLMEEPGIKAFRNTKIYSLNPIFVKGVFHPKIMFLVGKNDGLAVLGSGNLTASGMVSNDEVWSAFHQNNLASINIQVFVAIWKYLMSFRPQLLGFNIQKIEWLKQYSSWVGKLDDYPTNEFIPIKKDVELRLVTNSSSQSIYTQLKSILPQTPLKSLTIISPYYDTKGTFINQLHNDYNPENTIIIVDEQFGLLPTTTPLVESDNTQFISWYDCIKQGEKEYNRLHAKIIQFEYFDGWQYFIFGSPNATIRAFGSENKLAANAEAAFVIKKQTGVPYLSQMGIQIPSDKNIDLALYRNKSFVNPEYKISSSNHLVRIKHAEIHGLSLTFFVYKIIEEIVALVLLNEFDEIIETHVIQNLQLSHKIKASSTEIKKICIVDSEGERVSNFMLVYDTALQLKSNPDPNRAKFEEKFNTESLNGDNLAELLKYVVHDWKEETVIAKKETSQNSFAKTLNDSEKEYEVLNEKEFNTISASLEQNRQSNLLDTSAVRVIDFLNLMGKRIKIDKEEIIQESSEQALINQSDGEGDLVESQISHKINNQKEYKIQAEIEKYLKKTFKFYNKRLATFFKGKNYIDISKAPMSIDELGNFLIGLQLLTLYYGNSFTVETTDREKVVPFFNEGSFTGKKVSIYWFVNNIIGKFTLLANNGFEQYDYDLTNEKCLIFQQEALEKMLFITLNLPWSAARVPYLKIISLNILNVFSKNMDYQNNFSNRLKVTLEKQALSGNYIHPKFQKNLQFFLSEILKPYLSWLHYYNDSALKKRLIYPIEHLASKEIIFNSKLGFSLLYKKRFKEGKYQLSLLRTGFNLEEHINNQKDYLIKQIPFGTKVIRF